MSVSSKSLRIILAACFTLLLLSSCEERRPVDDDLVLARVGNQTLTLSEVRSMIPAGHFENDSLRIIETYRDRWINRQIKVREARRLGLHQQEEVRQRIEHNQETMLIDAFNQAVMRQYQDINVTRSEAQSYYESNKDKFILAERHVRYRHLIARSLADAQNARTALQRGRSWRDVASEFSVDPAMAIRHSQRYWPISSAALEFEPLHNFLQIIGVSEISPIRRIGDQFHFVQLMESRDAGEHPQVDWIIDQITDWLELDKRRKYLRSVEQNLYLQAKATNELQVFEIPQ